MDAISSAIPPTVEGLEAPDDDLARRAASDSRAMEALYLRHHLTIFRYLRARCRDDETAMDLTAITFEKAMRSIARYAPRGSGFPAWLLRIARNSAIDEERRRRPLLAGGWHALTRRRSQGPGPEEQAVAGDERRRMRLLLAELPDIQRDAVALRFGSDLTAREIGEVIGRSEEATQKLITRTLRRLKESLDD